MAKTIPSIEVEDNNGGSFVELSKGSKPGLCSIQVGHDSVVRVPYQEIEVTKLAQILADALNP